MTLLRLNLYTVPWVVSGFFKLITPFIDPLTREKLKFNEDVSLYVPREQLCKEDFNGDVDFEYDHDIYWPALVKICDERRAERKARWEKAGKRYGESEDFIKGGVEAIPDSKQEPVKADSETAQADSNVEEPVKVDSETTPVDAKVEEPRSTTGTQANDNLDAVAVSTDPKLTTEGDRE